MILAGDQLAAFAAVIDEGSFEAAARRLHLTPSAISQRIKALEGKLGQVLIQRSRPLQPTPAGQVLYRFAGQLDLLESEAFSAIGAGTLGTGITFRLPIAVNVYSLATWFLPVLASLDSALVATFDIRHERLEHTTELLRSGAVMAALTTDARAVQGCSVEPLGAMRYLAVASPGFVRRYLPSGPTPEAMATAPVLVSDRGDPMRERFVRMLTGRQVATPVTFLPTSWGFVEAALVGLAWAIVPEDMARSALAEGNLVELAAGVQVDVPLHWQRWRLTSTVLDALTAAVRAAAAVKLRPIV